MAICIKYSSKLKDGDCFIYLVERYTPSTKGGKEKTAKVKDRTIERLGLMSQWKAKHGDRWREALQEERIKAGNQAVYATRFNHARTTEVKSVQPLPQVHQLPQHLNAGAVFVRHFMERLELNKHLKQVRSRHQRQYDVDSLFTMQVASRLIDQKSRFGLYERANESLFDTTELKLRQLYDTLYIAALEQDNIIRWLNDGIRGPEAKGTTIAFFDVTTFYFETVRRTEDSKRFKALQESNGDHDSDDLEDFDEKLLRGDRLTPKERVAHQKLLDMGLSKDNKSSQCQVVMGLLIDQDGIPFNFRIFNGNTHEIHTLLKVVDDFLKATPSIKPEDLIVFADAGLNQGKNLVGLTQRAIRWAVGYAPWHRCKRAEKAYLKDALAQVQHEDLAIVRLDRELHTAVTETFFNACFEPVQGAPEIAKIEGTLYVCHDKDRRAYELDEMRKNWERCQEKLNAHKVKDKGRRYGYCKREKAQQDEWTLDEEAYRDDQAWAGARGLFVCKDLVDEIKPEGLLKLYGNLWKIENCFRTLKTSFDARPVFVRKPAHILGHFTVCYTALVVLRYMQHTLKVAGLKITEGELIEALRAFQVKAGSNGDDKYYCPQVQSWGRIYSVDKDRKASMNRAIIEYLLAKCGMSAIELDQIDSIMGFAEKTGLKMRFNPHLEPVFALNSEEENLRFLNAHSLANKK